MLEASKFFFPPVDVGLTIKANCILLLFSLPLNQFLSNKRSNLSHCVDFLNINIGIDPLPSLRKKFWNSSAA